MQTPPFDRVTEFLELFGGPIALVSAVAFSNGVAYRWRTERNPLTRKHLVPVLYWGPLFLMTCMVMHCLRNAYESYHFISNGIASFRFYQYSLQMFGVFLFYQAYLLLQECRRYVRGTQRLSPRLYGHMLLIVATTLPTWIFTPIGIVPTVVLVLILPVSLLVHKSRAAAPGPAASAVLRPAQPLLAEPA
ncbi:hypothetical protein LJ737_25290 [Hymenobacter sp. 15J16-1T3B]|uniref:hypothetical protein n=1 Tax=Hymenobacter sp. 15J16-1T3B TaxID=2886941 RepID=UPI001D10C5FC|nr:hypothetical protein [Hymenobacter sp. 15J16-1T3B]MCC3160577.1 hypothetical protein [Hymenobacter sp. 15J16-1T3B]